jgi:hypothetical protein
MLTGDNTGSFLFTPWAASITTSGFSCGANNAGPHTCFYFAYGN